MVPSPPMPGGMRFIAFTLSPMQLLAALLVGLLAAPPRAAALSASVQHCVDICIVTPAPAGHFECCHDPIKSSFSAPSCATGCLMNEYAHSLHGCEALCDAAKTAAPEQGCAYTIPGGPVIGMCDNCPCGLRDCPKFPPNAAEPETCKDPASGGPDGGDCGWMNRCRGSLEGCKKGCAIHYRLVRTGGGARPIPPAASLAAC